MKLEIELVEGGTDQVELPDSVPAYTGLETRNKIDAILEGNEKEQKLRVENAREKVNDAQQYLVSEILSNHTSYTVEDITINSFDRIAEEYWPQIQGEQKKSTGEG